eukprot:3853307-Rhodomonas_salina.1
MEKSKIMIPPSFGPGAPNNLVVKSTAGPPVMGETAAEFTSAKLLVRVLASDTNSNTNTNRNFDDHLLHALSKTEVLVEVQMVLCVQKVLVGACLPACLPACLAACRPGGPLLLSYKWLLLGEA